MSTGIFSSNPMPTVIDRKQAAEMLNVSIRTIDRYIQKGTLQKEEINGRIFLHTQDLKPLLDQKKLQNKYLSQLASDRPHSAPQPEQRPQQEQGSEQSFVQADFAQEESSDIYQKLYEELQEELKTKQERLEGANYRVGQLEGLLKESVPLLEYRKSLAIEEQKRGELEELLRTFEKDNEMLNQTVESKSTEVGQLAKNLKIERYNKKVFIIILVVLFLLQPLWLIFPVS